VTVEVYLAIDFFFENWKTTDRRLWLGVMPYLEDETKVSEWVEVHSKVGANLDYIMIDQIDRTRIPNDEKLIGIPLSADTDLIIKLKTSAGDEFTYPLYRTKNFKITKPEMFRALNAPPSNFNDELGDDSKDGLRQAPQKAYAGALIDAIQDMHKVHPEDLPTWLMMAFEIGERRHFSSNCMDDIGPYISVKHNEDTQSAGKETTSIHFLSGHMCPLDVPLQILQAIEEITLELDFGIRGKKSVTVHSDRDAKEGIRSFFSTISESFIDPKVEIQWSAGLKNRIYALPHARNFPSELLHGIANTYIYRLARDSDKKITPIKPVTMQELDRILIRYNVENKAAHPTAPQELAFKPISTFDLSVNLYRSYPKEKVNTTTTQNKKFILELSPQTHEKSRWEKFINDAYLNLGSNPDLTNTFELIKLSDRESLEQVKIDWLSIFRFPWELNNKLVVLACASEDLSGKYLGISESNYTGLKFELKGIDFSKDPFGPRWEFRPNSGFSEEFDGLKLMGLNTGLDQDRLIISSYAKQDFVFELAQSARRIEGVIRTGIETVEDVADPSAINAGDEYKRDFINHNKVNYFNEFGNSKTFLNRASESTPDFDESGKLANSAIDGHWYTYHFRFTEPTSVRFEQLDARSRYHKLYQNIPQNRKVSFDLEHTYGTHLSLGANAETDMPTYLDEILLHPANISEQLYNNATNDFTLDIKFILCDLSFSQGVSSLKLIFNQALLNLNWIDSQHPTIQPKLKETYIQAWQSVAELSAASKIELICEPHRFDFHQSLSNSEPEIGNGLYLSEPIIKRDMTKTISTLATMWLEENDEPEACDLEIPVDLNRPDLSTKNHVMRFQLVIDRSDEYYPHVSNSWTIVSKPTELPTPNKPESLFDANGAIVNVLTENEIKEKAENWLSGLSGASSYISPTSGDPNQKERIERYRGFIGGGPKIENSAPDAGAWIIPEGKAQSDGDANLIIIPMGFKPLKKSDLLGETTVKYVRNYFTLLQKATDLSSTYWAKTNDEKQWYALLRSWDKNGPSGSDFHIKYKSLCNKAKGTITPVPDTSQHSNVEQHVLDSAKQIKDQTTEINKQLYKTIEDRILADPSVFSKNKAFVFNRLLGDDFTSQAPIDFFSLKVHKTIGGVEKRNKASDPEVLSNEFTATYVDGLRIPKAPNWYGFLEELDDDIYDNDFVIDHASLSNIEEILEDVKTINNGNHLKGQKIYIPSELPQEMNKPGDYKEIYLPSRSLVQKPILMNSGIFKIEDFDRDFPEDQPLDFTAFINGVGTSKSSNSYSVKRVLSKHSNRNKLVDDVLVSYIFKIHGDEESQNGFYSSISNDIFYIDLQGEPHQSTTAHSSAVVKIPDIVFDDLAVASENDLSEIVSPATLQSFADLIQVEEPGDLPKIPKDFLASVEIKRKTTNPKPSDTSSDVELFVTESSEHRDWKYTLSVYLFRPLDTEQSDTAYLWIDLELSVWKEWYVTLYQSRNSTEVGRHFSPEFSMLSLQKSDSFSPKSSLIISMSKEDPFAYMGDLSCTPKTFLKNVFQIKGKEKLQELGDSSGQQDFYVNITVNQIIEPIYPVAGSQSGQKPDHVGTFPILNIRVRDDKSWNQDVVNWFQDFPEICIDVEWRRKSTNDILFRIENYRLVRH
jgi:hypothetical protein